MHWAIWKLTLKCLTSAFVHPPLSLLCPWFSALGVLYCHKQWVCLGVLWKEIQYSQISFITSHYSWNTANTGGRTWGRKTTRRKAEWSPGEPKKSFKSLKLCSPRLRGRPETCQRNHGSTQEDCSGSSALELYPSDLLSNFLGYQCCSSNDIFFTRLFQLCFLMQLSQISLGSCQEKEKKRGIFLFWMCSVSSLLSELVMLLTMTS